jgi:hypothetical protein
MKVKFEGKEVEVIWECENYLISECKNM